MTASAILEPTITALRKQREECVQRLILHKDYQNLLTLDRALKALEGVDDTFGLVDIASAQITTTAPTRVRERLSQSNAAFQIIRNKGPLPVWELLPLVQELGATVGGEEPTVNLSSSLSRDTRFKSFRDARGVYLWTLNTPIEAALADISAKDNGGTTGARTPAAVDNQSQEGGEGHETTTSQKL